MIQSFRSHPATALLVTALIIIPATTLLRLISTQPPLAVNTVRVDDPLIQISETAVMLQSFRVETQAGIPALWIERFGRDAAVRLWSQRDGQLWWQAWPEEGDPFLIIAETPPGAVSDGVPRFSKATDSIHRHRGLMLLFSDALNREAFEQRFSPDVAVSPPIERFCINQLKTTTAVLWRPFALASLAGDLAPLLQSASHGCVAIELRGRELRWLGVVASRSLREASSRLRPPDPTGSWRQDSIQSDQAGAGQRDELLRLQSHSARLFLGALLNRPLIRDGLESNYGLDSNLRNQLLAAPLSLQLRRNEQGPFRAAVQLDLVFRNLNPQAIGSLKVAGERLKSNGLQSGKRRLQTERGDFLGEETLWYDDTENTRRLLGGWSWRKGDSSGDGNAELQMTLARKPDHGDSPAVITEPGNLVARLRPSALKRLGLLAESWPGPVQRARVLEFSMRPLDGSATSHEDWRSISGYLELP